MLIPLLFLLKDFFSVMLRIHICLLNCIVCIVHSFNGFRIVGKYTCFDKLVCLQGYSVVSYFMLQFFICNVHVVLPSMLIYNNTGLSPFNCSHQTGTNKRVVK
jgi:hypothetical protein